MSVAILLLAAAATGSTAQAPDSGALAGFVALARAATARFHSLDDARAAGYRPVGPDFPSMGQHWVHSALILRETLDGAEPAILEYADVTGRPTLVGVAYAVLARDGRSPAGLPVPADAWHFHRGTVEQESFLPSHAGAAHVDPGPGIAVLHAWVWLDNPDGLLATDNWALPYARLGYEMPRDASRDAGRALTLAAGDGGRAYLEALLRVVGRPSPAEARRLATLVTRHQEATRALLRDARQGPPPATQLAACWSALWEDVRGVVRPEVWERLAASH